ncbi:hypothetical protein ACJMK2_025041 [Sinanodonta woodiana]|uniref:Uncharacterized protein n=1 Tax=Sinanodonta woodiana TaxID=1069815 RepID=A0ABD3XFB3_SINWO
MEFNQFFLLNDRILDQQRRARQYSLRLRLEVMESVRDVYYHYCQEEKADISYELRRELCGERSTDDENLGHPENGM